MVIRGTLTSAHFPTRHLNNDLDRIAAPTAGHSYGTIDSSDPVRLPFGDLAMKTWREELFAPLQSRIVADCLEEVCRGRRRTFWTHTATLSPPQKTV